MVSGCDFLLQPASNKDQDEQGCVGTQAFLTERLHFGREEPANQRNLTGVSPELMLEWVMVLSGLIM